MKKPFKADVLAGMIAVATQAELHRTGEYFSDLEAENFNDLTQCRHGDKGKYRDRYDGELIAYLWNHASEISDRWEAMENALKAAREQMAIAFADPERLIKSAVAMNSFALAMEQVREVLGDAA